jgi:ubiquinone biosynthesis protein UbiJ
MKKIILSSLTKSINACLALDAESTQRLKPLQGKVMAIELLPMHITFQCVFENDGIHIVSDETLIIETTLRGTPMQMLGVMIDKKNRNRFFADDLVMEGNAELGQQVVELFDRLEIDWEEYISKLVGDVPAYHTGRLVRTVKHWLSNSGNDICRDISDYFQEEAKWLPSRESLNDFFCDIDLIRMDVDRMEARINQLNINLNDDEGAK